MMEEWITHSRRMCRRRNSFSAPLDNSFIGKRRLFLSLRMHKRRLHLMEKYPTNIFSNSTNNLPAYYMDDRFCIPWLLSAGYVLCYIRTYIFIDGMPRVKLVALIAVTQYVILRYLYGCMLAAANVAFYLIVTLLSAMHISTYMCCLSFQLICCSCIAEFSPFAFLRCEA